MQRKKKIVPCEYKPTKNLIDSNQDICPKCGGKIVKTKDAFGAPCPGCHKKWCDENTVDITDDTSKNDKDSTVALEKITKKKKLSDIEIRKEKLQKKQDAKRNATTKLMK